MRQLIRLDEDWHVCSAFPADPAADRETVHAAQARGLKRICLVAKVRRHSEWVGEFARACRTLDRATPVEVSAGIEAEVMDLNGTLELPAAARSVDHLYVDVRRLPTPAGPVEVGEAGERIAAGALLPSRAVEWVVRAAANATMREGSVILAQPLRILSELGIDSRSVHPAYVRWLAASLAERDAAVEICEHPRCPSAGVLRSLRMAGVTVLASSGSADPAAVGRYEWCRAMATELAGCGPRVEPPEPIFVA